LNDKVPSTAESALAEQFKEDVSPVTLSVKPRTWRSLKSMGVNLDDGCYEFIDEGTHIWSSFFHRWGWWKTVVLGFYPYTDLRDYEAHERQGIGRPWLAQLPERWQELIFRELILLILEWNSLVAPEYWVSFEEGEELPGWVQRWLSLTNQSWRRGISEFESALFSSVAADNAEEDILHLVQQYRLSASTWRLMMPEEAIYRRKYGSRNEYWEFVHRVANVESNNG
jgi:hypothetical protein